VHQWFKEIGSSLIHIFPRISRIGADMNWLRKTTVGRRCDQETLPQRFLAQPDGLYGLRPCAAQQHSFPAACKHQ
jgi:hypothetical protein